MPIITVQVPEEWAEHVDDLAQEHNTTRAAVLRCTIDNGLRAPKYHPDEFSMDPEQYERKDAVELAREGKINR
jgi:predicted transcriptional regulator